MNVGFFTGQGLLSFVFIAVGFFLFYKGRSKTSPYAKTDKRIYLSAFISIAIGIILFVIYLNQMKGVS